jgi:hypothetical protein
MTRMMVTMLISLFIGGHAIAQNATSQKLIAFSEQQRNLFFLKVLQGSNDKCDQVIRTLFVSGGASSDGWEALCRDGNSYGFNIPANPTQVIKLLNCREQAAINKMMETRSGVKFDGDCRIK